MFGLNGNQAGEGFGGSYLNIPPTLRQGSPLLSITPGQEMDPRDYNELLKKLDVEFADLQKIMLARGRIKEIRAELVTLKQQREGLQERLREYQKLDADGLVAEAQKHIDDIDSEVSMLRLELLKLDPDETEEFEEDDAYLQTRSIPEPSKAEQILEEDARYEVIKLIEEVEQMAVYLEDVSAFVRESQFHVWALRWRIVAERLGQEKANKDSVMRRSYAVLRAWMKKYPDLPFIDALNPRATGEWEVELKAAQREQAAIVARENSAEESREALVALREVISEYYLPEDEEGREKLFEAVGICARHLHIRDEVAKACEPLRDLLEKEFGFLWRKEKKGSKKSKSKKAKEPLSGREIMTKMLSRMLGKKKIGNSHTPLTNMLKGLKGRDRKRAEEAVKLLVSGGYIRYKRGTQEQHVSIPSQKVGAVEGFCNGSSIGNTTIDKWCSS